MGYVATCPIVFGFEDGEIVQEEERERQWKGSGEASGKLVEWVGWVCGWVSCGWETCYLGCFPWVGDCCVRSCWGLSVVWALETQRFFAWPSPLSLLLFSFCDTSMEVSLGSGCLLVWRMLLSWVLLREESVLLSKGSLLKGSFGWLEKNVVDFCSWKMLGQFLRRWRVGFHSSFRGGGSSPFFLRVTFVHSLSVFVFSVFEVMLVVLSSASLSCCVVSAAFLGQIFARWPICSQFKQCSRLSSTTNIIRLSRKYSVAWKPSLSRNNRNA